jgi:hypothetical protein
VACHLVNSHTRFDVHGTDLIHDKSNSAVHDKATKRRHRCREENSHPGGPAAPSGSRLYAASRPDGVMGPSMIATLKEFQSAHESDYSNRLSVTGLLDDKTLTARGKTTYYSDNSNDVAKASPHLDMM